MCNVPDHPPTMHNPSPPHARCSLHHKPTSRIKLRSTCAMIDASALFLCFTSTPASSTASRKLRAVACPTTFARAGAHTKLHALLSPPTQRENPQKHMRRCYRRLCKKKACAKAAPTKPGRPPASGGRPAPPQRAGVRLRLTVRSDGEDRGTSHSLRMHLLRVLLMQGACCINYSYMNLHARCIMHITFYMSLHERCLMHKLFDKILHARCLMHKKNMNLHRNYI